MHYSKTPAVHGYIIYPFSHQEWSVSQCKQMRQETARQPRQGRQTDSLTDIHTVFLLSEGLFSEVR